MGFDWSYISTFALGCAGTMVQSRVTWCGNRCSRWMLRSGSGCSICSNACNMHVHISKIRWHPSIACQDSAFSARTVSQSTGANHLWVTCALQAFDMQMSAIAFTAICI